MNNQLLGSPSSNWGAGSYSTFITDGRGCQSNVESVTVGAPQGKQINNNVIITNSPFIHC